jgi:hypothetical protein
MFEMFSQSSREDAKHPTGSRSEPNTPAKHPPHPPNVLRSKTGKTS